MNFSIEKMNAISDSKMEILKMKDEIDARDIMMGIQNRQIAEKESKEKILVKEIFEKAETIDELQFVNNGHWNQILQFGATMKKSDDRLTQKEVMLNHYEESIKTLESSKFISRNIILELNNFSNRSRLVFIAELEKKNEQIGHFKGLYEVSIPPP